KSWEGQRSGKGGNETKPRVSSECPRCFEPNPAGELFCAHCGYFLGGDSSQHETTRLSDPEQLERGSDYFGPDSVLVLMLPNNQAFNVQPQRYRHETVIGRAEGSTMRPDIDLSGYNASAQGASRLH